MKKKSITLAKQVLWKLSPRLFNNVIRDQHPQTFSIGVFTGTSPLELIDPQSLTNPILSAADISDVPAGFVADPFMLKRDDRWYMFFEVFDKILRRGCIGVATSEDCRSWQYQNVALRESFHMAYPQVLEHEDELIMVPDTPGQGVRLYRAQNFPLRWEFVKTLIDDSSIVDPTLFRYDDRWWLFAGGLSEQGKQMPLRLYHAEHISGPWQEHVSSPVKDTDERSARPSGSVVVLGNRLFRFAQDGIPVYGSCVRAFEITELSLQTYSEQEISDSPLLTAGQDRWKSGGMHHMNAHQLGAEEWVACVDGWYAT